MVTLKKLFLATSILLSRVAATTFLASDLSVAAIKVCTVGDFAIEPCDLYDSAEIEKRNPMPKNPKPKKTKASKPPKKTIVSNPPNSKSTSAPKSKSISTPKPTTTNAATLSKAPACALRTKNIRSLERREGPLMPAKSPKDINEDIYVLSAEGKVVVTNLSGCTALFLWDASDKPSVFHIFCEDEVEKTWEAINKVGRKAKAISIVASSLERYNNTKMEIVEYAKAEGWPALHEEDEELYELPPPDKLYKFIATAGSKTITRVLYPRPDCE